MALDVNTEAWGNPESWVTDYNDGDCLKYPWNRQRWTDIKSHIRSGTDLDLSIAPWLINKDSALVNLTACSWYNNYEDLSGTVINRYDIGNAYADEFNPLAERQDTPFILSMWWRDRSGKECWSPYWAYDFDTNTDTNSGYINGERFPVANFRYDKIRVVPVIALTSQDPINSEGNRSDTRYVGIPTADQIASEPYCCGIGYQIYCEKNGTMVQKMLTVDLDTHFNGFLSTAYSAGHKSYGGTSGARMVRAPKFLVSSGNYYNWLFYNTGAISTNSNINRRGSTRARDYLFTRASWDNNTSSLGAFAGKVDGFAFNSRNVQSTSGTTFSGYYYMQVPDRDTLKEIVMEQLAYIGLPFVLSENDVSKAIGHEDVYLPVFGFGENHRYKTTGQYKSGTQSLTLPNASWQWVYDIENYSGAFEDSDKLERVRIPNSAKAIGQLAFSGTALRHVRIAADATYSETSFPEGCIVTRYPDDRYEQVYDGQGRIVLDRDARRILMRRTDE